MSTDLERRLREALHEDAQRARLVNPDRPPAGEAQAIIDAPRWRSGRRILAVAAVIALIALVAVAALDDDAQKVDTVPPVTEPPVTEAPMPTPTVQTLPDRMIVSGSGCPFGISGDPVDMHPGSISERFGSLPGQGEAYILLGAQTAEVLVPGFERTEDGGWRDEPVEVGGRSATVWLDGPVSASRDGTEVVGSEPVNLPFVQVRYFPASDEPCSSFTVTVDGGTEDANRDAAVDLASRILLPSDLEDLDLPGTEGGPVVGLGLPGTTWEVTPPGTTRLTTRPPVPVPGPAAEMTFTDATVRWEDGCATVTADYELDRENGILTLTNATSTDPGCTPPTDPERTLIWPTIASVMGQERISVSLIAGLLFLGDYPTGEYLELGPPR